MDCAALGRLKQTILERNLISVSEYQDLSFSTWIKGSADMTSPVLSNSMMVAASSADVQVVAGASCILVDVQSWHFDTAGQSRRDHACAGLSVNESRRLHALLGKAIAIAAEAETRQGQMQLAARRSAHRNSANSCACPSTVPATAIMENGFVVPATKRAGPAGRR